MFCYSYSMDRISEIIKLIEDIRISGDYSWFDRLPQEFIREQKDINQIKGAFFNSLMIENRKCIYPGCIEKAIHSHSIQRSYLSKLADSTSHLIKLSFKPLFGEHSGIDVVAERIGVSDASTFMGFCKNHDKELFKPIENGETISISNAEQMFLFLYRSICREFVECRNGYQSVIHYSDELKSKVQITDEHVLFLIKYAYLQYLEFFWIEKIKQVYDLKLSLKEYSPRPFVYKSLEMDYIPVYVNAFFVLQGARGDIEYENDIQKKMPYFFCINAIPSNNRLVILYCYIKDQEEDLKPVLRRLNTSDKTELELFLSDMILRNSDNIIFSPDYWARFTEDKQNKIKEFVYKSTNDRKCYPIDVNLWNP